MLVKHSETQEALWPLWVPGTPAGWLWGSGRSSRGGGGDGGAHKAWNPSVRGRPGQLASEREPSNSQFSTVRKMPCAPLTPRVRAASPAFHQHVCRARRGLRTHATRTPQPRMRTPGVGLPCRAHSGDQTDLFSSITKAVDVTLSEDSVHFNQRSEQRLFPKPGARSTARPAPWTADRLVGRAPFTQGHAHAVHAAGKTPGAGAGTPGQGTGGHVGALRVTLAMVRSANGNPPPCTHTL